MSVARRSIVLQGLVLLGLFLALARGSHAATATWCHNNDVMREIVVVEGDGGSCAVDYNKPFEDGPHPDVWRARRDSQFCRDRSKELVVKLGRAGWLCSLDFFVRDGRFERKDTMAEALRRLQTYRRLVATNLGTLSKLNRDTSFAISVGLYQGPFRDAGAPRSGDVEPSYAAIEQASDQAIFLFWTLVHCDTAADGAPVFCHYLGFDHGVGPSVRGALSVRPCPTTDNVAQAADIFLIGNSQLNNYSVSVTSEGIRFADAERRLHGVIRAEHFDDGYRMRCLPAAH